MSSKNLHLALDQISQQGLVRARDLALLGVTGGTLEKMLITGSLVRLGEASMQLQVEHKQSSTTMLKLQLNIPDSFFAYLQHCKYMV